MKLSDFLPKNDDADIEQKSYKRYDYKTPPIDLLLRYPPVDCSEEEAPNKNMGIVGLRDVVGSPLFTRHKSPIPFAVGKDLNGELVVCDLEKIPHFLIAGQSGYEKSVGLNSLIIGLLYKSSPEDVRFILIDPERKRFSKFSGMPHLLFDKIVTKPIEALNALDWANKEMDRRYRLMQKYDCCKLSEYNGLPEVVSGKLSKLPHIVIIIDELATLMRSLLTRLVEEKISSIAALARAAGIHLVAATQHPTADVITGFIKVNLTSRIAYKVEKTVNSRIIIDVDGAEMLAGNGDMLYHPYDEYAPKRVQGAFVGDEEAAAVADYIKQNYQCDFDEEAEKYVSGGDGDGEGIENDPILPSVIAYVIKKGKISPTVIQRRFAIGYAKAARIVDYMEEQGFISLYNEPRPRKVLITREEYKEIYGQDVDDVW